MILRAYIGSSGPTAAIVWTVNAVPVERLPMKQSTAAWLGATLTPLTIAACERVAEAVPIAADADAAISAYVSTFSAMHSAIPATANIDIEEYQ